MNIVFIAYGCSSKYGGEYKIGWSIPINMAENNNVIVITRSCFKQEHEENKELLKNKRIKFYYVDNNTILTHLFRGQLEPIILKSWNRKVLKFLKKLSLYNDFDVIHQITPLEFRSLGDFGKIKNIKYIVGPLGGAEYMPKELEYYIPSFKIKVFEFGRRISNSFNRKLLFYKAKKIDYAMFANDETASFLSEIPFNNTGFFNDTGIDKELIKTNIIKKSKDRINFLTAGRLVYRKGHLLLIDAISSLSDTCNAHFFIAGDGPMKKKLMDYVEEKGLNSKITFLGKIPYERMKEIYNECDVFIMPSLRETGGSVILEALSNGLPLIAPNAYGAKKIIDTHTGFLYEINNDRIQVVKNLKNAIEYFITNSDKLYKMSLKCIELVEKYTWRKKCNEYNNLYIELIKKDGDR